MTPTVAHRRIAPYCFEASGLVQGPLYRGNGISKCYGLEEGHEGKLPRFSGNLLGNIELWEVTTARANDPFLGYYRYLVCKHEASTSYIYIHR